MVVHIYNNAKDFRSGMKQPDELKQLVKKLYAAGFLTDDLAFGKHKYMG